VLCVLWARWVCCACCEIITWPVKAPPLINPSPSPSLCVHILDRLATHPRQLARTSCPSHSRRSRRRPFCYCHPARRQSSSGRRPGPAAAAGGGQLPQQCRGGGGRGAAAGAGGMASGSLHGVSAPQLQVRVCLCCWCGSRIACSTLFPRAVLLVKSQLKCPSPPPA